MADGSQVRARSRRQVPVMLLGVLLVAGSALGVALWSGAQSDRESVLVAAGDLQPGQVLTAVDLRAELVAVPGSVGVVREGDLDRLVGSTVRVPVEEGELLAPSMVVDESQVVPDGMALVGASLTVGRFPPTGLRSGDAVVLVDASNDGADRLGVGEVFSVVEVTEGARAGDVTVGLLVEDSGLLDAAAGAAAAGSLTLVAVPG